MKVTLINGSLLETSDATAQQMIACGLAKAIEEKAKSVGGHGGMDYIMDYRLIYCLHHGLPLDEDVYDAAEWSAVQELSRISLENGSMPVRFPDFTRGDWNVTDGFHYAQ